jgi:hypothetical protein
MVENKPKKMPEFDTLDELVSFFDENDMGEYWEDLPEVDLEADIQTQTYMVTLDNDLARQVAQVARAKQLSPFELIESWIKVGVQSEQQPLAG